MHKPNCVSKDDVKQALVKIASNQHAAEAKGISEEHDKMTRVNIFDVTADDVKSMVDSFSSDDLVNSEKVVSKSIGSKLKNALKKASLPANKEYVKGIMDNLFSFGTKDGRANAMALKLVMDTIEGEINKANNLNVDLDTVSNEAGIPYIPTHRLAASLGRQIYYTMQYRVHKGNIDKKDKSKHVEHLYYVAGIRALKSLEQKGFIKLHDGGNVNTVKDYLYEDEAHYDSKEKTTNKAMAIELKAESLGAKDLTLNSTDEVLTQLRGTSEERAPIPKAYSNLESLKAMLKAVGYVSTPVNVSLPFRSTEERKESTYANDAYRVDGTAALVRNDLQNAPVYFNDSMFSFFKLLSEELKNSTDDAATRIKQLMANNKNMAKTMFGFEPRTNIVSDAASNRGRDLSKTTPINDLIEYFEAITDGATEPTEMYMAMFGGRNVRMYYSNSVVNPHSSKFMRHALAVKPYELNRTDPAANFFLNKIAEELSSASKNGYTKIEIIKVLNKDIVSDREIALDKELTQLRKTLNTFNSAKSATAKLNAATNMYRNFDGIDMAAMVSLAQASQDWDMAVETGILNSSYMVSSDATASGGQLTLMQALGISPDVEQLMRQLGVLKGRDNKERIKDVYAVLQKELDYFFNPETTFDDDTRQFNPDESENLYLRDTLKAVLDTLYDGDPRDLSKGPTMTFIYDQSKSGAIESLSGEFTERFFKAFAKATGPKQQELIKFLETTGLEGVTVEDIQKKRSFKKTLQSHFANTGAPEFLFGKLKESLEDRVLKQYKDRSNQVWELVLKLGIEKMKVFPAQLILDKELYGRDVTHEKRWLEEYGVPLSKVFETAKAIGDDTVLTREERLRQTVMNVSLIHGTDTANLLHGLKGLTEKYDNTGTVIVHDDIRSRPDLVMEAEKQYIETNYNIGIHYDIHEQVLLSAAAYADAAGNKDFKNTPTYTKLLSNIQVTKQARKDLLESRKNGYDFETDSVIGDKNIDWNGPENSSKQNVPETRSSNVQAETTTKSEENTSNSVVPKLDLVLKQKLDKARSKSSLIDAFLSSKVGSKVVSGTSSRFDPKEDKVLLDTSLSEKEFIQEAEHEIVHAYTAAVIQDHVDNIAPTNEMAYIEKALDKLNKFVENAKDTGGLSNEAFGRVVYINSKSSKKEQLAEFIAIMYAEPEEAAQIYKVLDNGNRLSDVVTRVLKKIRDIITGPTEEDVLSSKVDAALLETSLNTVVTGGKSLRESKYETFIKLQKRFDSDLGYGGKREVTGPLSLGHSWVDALNDSVSKRVVERITDKGQSLAGRFDSLLKQEFPAYARVVRRAGKFYDDSTTLQQVMHKITNGNVDKLKKNEILSIFTKVAADKENVTSAELKRFKDAMKGVSDVDKQSFNDFSTKMSLGDYYRFYPDGVADVDKEIADLEQGYFNKEKIAQFDKLVDFYVNDNVIASTPYNLAEMGYHKGKLADKAKQLLVLKSLKAIGPNRFKELLKNTELMDVARDNVLANQAILARNPNIDTSKIRSTGVIDSYKDAPVFKEVSLKELKYYDENNEWTVIRKPTDKSIGVVYKPIIDNTYQTGVFTGIQTSSGDIDVTGKNKKLDGVMKVGDSYKVVLTQREKMKAGLVENSYQSIVRTMTHNLAIQDSNVIREKVLEKDTYYDIAKNGIENLVKVINDKEKQNPWFLGDLNDRDFSKLPNKVKANYMRVPVKMSNVDGFDQRVKYVRKDVSYWLTGVNEQSVARSKPVQVGMRIAKGLISGTKIGTVILNPAKIAMDNVFNVVYLSTLGVDVVEMAKSYNTVAKQYSDYTEMQDEVTKLRVRSYANEDNAKRIEELNKRIESHPMHNIVKRGFTSLQSSEIVHHEDNPNGGFKGDLDKILTTIFKDNKGDNNKLAEVVLKVAKSKGFQMNEFLEVFSGMFGVKGATKNVQSELKKMGKRFEEIKNDDDIIGYMHQYLNSPDSEFVKLGTHMTDMTDILAKETYFRHLVDKKGVSESEAEKAVITAFPDYKEGLPTTIQKLDSVGIVMYPQYWLRMIQAMYRLAEKRPASFGSEMLIAKMMGTESQLWSQTIINKAASNWGLVHNPVNHIGVGSVVPTNVW
ncbi:RNA polymerase [Alteromonas phage vB_AmeP_PT11-V19]|nr:RNA polymerase [Alteromonas phage vB_AmeP_PT11-V19]